MSNDPLGLKPTLEDYYNLLEKNRKLKSVGEKLLLDNIKKTKQIKKYKTKLKTVMYSFKLCLRIIDQERTTSTDERTRKEMARCVEIAEDNLESEVN